MGQVVAVTGLPMGDSGGPVSLDTHTGLLCFLDPPICEAPGVHEMIRSKKKFIFNKEKSVLIN